MHTVNIIKLYLNYDVAQSTITVREKEFVHSLAGQYANHIVQLVCFYTHCTVVKIWIRFLPETHTDTHSA